MSRPAPDAALAGPSFQSSLLFVSEWATCQRRDEEAVGQRERERPVERQVVHAPQDVAHPRARPQDRADLAKGEVPAVEVVSGVDALPSLFVERYPRVEVPVVASVNGNELIPIDVDAGRECEAPRRVEERGEMCVGQFTNQGSGGRSREWQRDLEEIGVVSSRRK